MINSEAVTLAINNLKQLVPDVNQLSRRQFTFKYGILHSLSDIFTGSGHLPQPPLSGLVIRSYIIRNENIHDNSSFYLPMNGG